MPRRRCRPGRRRQLSSQIVTVGGVTTEQLDEVIADIRGADGGLTSSTPILVAARGRRSLAGSWDATIPRCGVSP